MKWLGVVICGVGILCVPFLYWPMWGGMVFPIKKGYTEEDYYFSEYSPDEREKGLHLANSAFVRPLHAPALPAQHPAAAQALASVRAG